MVKLALIGDGESIASCRSVSGRISKVEIVEDAGDADAVVLANGLLVTAIEQAAAGRHVLLCGSLSSSDDAQSLVSAAADAGVRLMTGSADRFLPSLQTVKQSIAGGQLGQPGLLRIHRWEPAGSGGAIGSLSREISLARWLFDAEPDHVYAVGRGRSAESTSDYVQLHLGFPNDGMALIDLSRTLPAGDGYFSLSVIGSTGATYADGHHNAQLVFGGGSPSARITGEGPAAVIAQVTEFVSAIEEGREPSPGGNDLIATAKVAEAAADSIESSETVRLAG